MATEIHFKNWSKELKSFMNGKKTEDYLLRDRPLDDTHATFKLEFWDVLG